jgi:hypothetical protein
MSSAGAEICRWEMSRFSADRRSPHPARRLLRGGLAVDGGQSRLTRELLDASSMGAMLSSPASTGGRWEEGRSGQDLEERWLGQGKGRGGECSARVGGADEMVPEPTLRAFSPSPSLSCLQCSESRFSGSGPI